jgi:hypothetical protein
MKEATCPDHARYATGARRRFQASSVVTSDLAQAVVPLKRYIHHGISNSTRQLLESPPAVMVRR